MRCIFCKRDSSASRSVEHILPESLGNTKRVLPKGVVCDGCNNYFSKSVEQPFLEAENVKLLRFHEALVSKRGRIPQIMGGMMPGVPVQMRRDAKTGQLSVAVPTELFQRLKDEPTSQLLLPTTGRAPPPKVISRFMAKVAIESVAERLTHDPALLEQFVDDTKVDPLRNHARRGQPANWAVHIRQIYDTKAKTYKDDHAVQVVHESDFLITEDEEIFHAQVIFGIEFTINIGAPGIDGYVAWLTANDHASPLYFPENKGPYEMPKSGA